MHKIGALFILHELGLLTVVPQYKPNQFNLTSYNSTCVRLTWSIPEYPGGPITRYQVGIFMSPLHLTAGLYSTVQSICT